MKPNNKNGFTLVEMMIVVTIIAILVGMAVPKYNKYVRKSKTSEPARILKQIADAEQTYYSVHGVFSAPSGAYVEVDKDKLGIDIDTSGFFDKYEYMGCADSAGKVIGVILKATATTENSQPVYYYFPGDLAVASDKTGYQGSFFPRDYIEDKITGNAPTCP
jgi:prepilin-type N-terminal cleavage/methylation domain-containing protein